MNTQNVRGPIARFLLLSCLIVGAIPPLMAFGSFLLGQMTGVNAGYGVGADQHFLSYVFVFGFFFTPVVSGPAFIVAFFTWVFTAPRRSENYHSKKQTELQKLSSGDSRAASRVPKPLEKDKVD